MADLTEEELKRFKRKKNFLEKLAELQQTSRPSLNENLKFSEDRKYPKVGPDYFQRFPGREVLFEILDVLKEISSLAERDGSISEDNESIVSNQGSLDRLRIKDPKGRGRMDQKWRKILSCVLGPKRAATLVGSDSSDSDEEIGASAGGSSDEKSETAAADGWTGWKWETSNNGKLGTTEKSRVMVYWTKSRYEGQWDKELNAPHGLGMYTMPHGVTYVGGMHDGRFHGKGVLRYPNGAMVEGNWSHGRIQKRSIIFPDGLRYKEKDWDYCSPPDRRFHIERLYGLRAAGHSHLTQRYPTRRIPAGCYDTADGYYNHRTRCVHSADTGKVLRIPTNKEAEWIMENCRKAQDENVNYEPDIFAGVRDESDLEAMAERMLVPESKRTGAKHTRKSYLGGKTSSRRGSLNERRDDANEDSLKSASYGQKKELAQGLDAPKYETPPGISGESLEKLQGEHSVKRVNDKEYMTELIEELWVKREESGSSSIEEEILISSIECDESL